jgi:hypothetical protein
LQSFGVFSHYGTYVMTKKNLATLDWIVFVGQCWTWLPIHDAFLR